MNSVQLENTNVGYSLAEPTSGSPTSAPADVPSFDDHLQQARQQTDPAPQTAQRDQPQKPLASDDPVAAKSAPQKDEAAEHPRDERAEAADPPVKEKPDKEATKKDPTAAEASAIATVCANSLIVANPAIQVAALPTAVEAQSNENALTPDKGTLPAPPAASAKADLTKQVNGITPLIVPPVTSDALTTHTNTIEAASAAAASTPASAANVTAVAQSIEVAATAPAPVRNKENHAAKEAAAEAPVIVGAAFAALDLASPQDPSAAAPLIAASEDASEKVAPTSPQDAAPTSNEEGMPNPDAASAPSGDSNSSKAPSFALPARTSKTTGGGTHLSEADRIRFVQRVARAFEAAGDNGQMRLRLSPPELGSLRLDVSVRQGLLTAHVEAETPQARLLLLDNLPALRERLQEQNIKIERFDVDLMNQSPGGQPQGFRQQRSDGDEPAFNLNNVAAPAEATVERPAGTARRLGGGEKLNVVI